MNIGVFDSGLGGLSILNHLQKKLPGARFIYVADSANAPYGTKSDDFIAARCASICRFLLQQDVVAIVVACNTATAVAVTTIRQMTDIPVVAVEPAVKPACESSQNGHIGVLATASTLASQQYRQLLEKFSNGVQCHACAGHGLVEQVEAGLLDSDETLSLLKKYIEPMLQKNIDALVLGCTHYPFLIPAIRTITGDKIRLLETGAAVAGQLCRVLECEDVQCPDEIVKGIVEYYSSANPQQAAERIEKLLGEKVKVSALPV